MSEDLLIKPASLTQAKVESIGAPDSGLAGMPPWMAALEGQWLPPQKNAAWVPTYLPPPTVSEPGPNGTSVTQTINGPLFPTPATVSTLQQKYGAVSVNYTPYVDAGADTSSAMIPWLVWANGVAIVAGMLAVLWTNNPYNPDVADSLCRAYIVQYGAK
jgi:hypothetical protein